MSIETQTFMRKTFAVEAQQVTAENMAAVAEWCRGTVVGSANGDYIKVQVKNPQHERQTMAFVGSWVAYFNRGFKVFSDAAFKQSFERPGSQQVFNVFAENGDAVSPEEIGRRAQRQMEQAGRPRDQHRIGLPSDEYRVTSLASGANPGSTAGH